MELSTIIACICEGGAETAIIDMLIDSGKLIFSREQLLDEQLIGCRNAKKFEQRYLRKDFDDVVTILRILDSHREGFNVSPAYVHKVQVYDVVTAPEIEMLIILNEGKYKDYCKKASTESPSEFCKMHLSLGGDIKSQEFIKDYFSDIDKLIGALKEYKRVKKLKRGELYLADLLK